MERHPEAKTGPTLAERLGYSPSDRLLLLHADDAGMCHSANLATIRALEAGIVTCAAVMVPCPWFLEMADYARDHPEADLGVHLTLTSEWRTYRWGPVAPAGPESGILDDAGCFPRGWDGLLHARPDAVAREFRAQVDRAVRHGIVPTHLDSHMGTAFSGAFFPAYLQTARETGIMPMLVETPAERREEILRVRGLDLDRYHADLQQEGFLFLNHLDTGRGGATLEARRDAYYQALRNLPAGVSEILLHLAMDDPEIRAITSHWEARWHEFQIFTDDATRNLIESLGIRRIGYRDLARLDFPAPTA